MTIPRKIIGGYAILLALFLLVALGAFSAFQNVQKSYEHYLSQTHAVLTGFSDLRFAASNEVRHYRGLFLFPDQQQTLVPNLAEDVQAFHGALEKLRRTTAIQDAAALDEIEQIHARLAQSIERAIALVRRGKTAEAIAMSESEMLPQAQLLTKKAEQFRDAQLALIANQRQALERSINRLMAGILLATVVGFLFGLASSIYLSRSITRQLRETIQQLTTAAAEILATTTQVASSTAETATAVSQTTTTVEEVKQTVQVASQKAKQVSDSAQQTEQTSNSGKQALEDMMAGMQRIRQQTASTAEIISRLNEQSQVIGEIIASVNDLAEQSNLLAVNAAIEAAKAGEFGKGFAVVAQEIKSLAEQSKQATTQVRSILGDTQKATGAAVMATDLNSKAVEEGIRQAESASTTIIVLGESIGESAQAALQIAASGQQQMVGMDQVAMAMENIKQASAQNMAGTKQAEIAAKNLHEVGIALQSLVGNVRT